MNITILASSSKGNCIQIDDGATRLLLDAGLPFPEIKRRLNFQTSSLSGALITHSHADHSRGCRDMLKAGIDCYMSESCAHDLGLNGHRVHILKHRRTEPLSQFAVGTWAILPFKVVHDVENVGFLLVSGQEKAVYITDTSYCPHRFAGLTHVLIEANWSKRTLAPDLEPAVKRRLYRNHFSLENVKKFLQANDLSLVREVHLLHLSAGNSDAALFKTEIEKLTGKPVYVANQ
jgi:phosphoribosyl 1,2-cyclic phosphodiesterase